MAKRCDICAKGPTKGHRRSHSNRQTLKRQFMNLQSAVIDGTKVKLCARCLKTSKKPAKAAAKAAAKAETKTVVKKAKPVAKKVKAPAKKK